MVSRKQLPNPAGAISGADRPMTAKVMKSLDEYEQLLAPVRECFAISPGVQAINSRSNDVFLESFLLHFCALGSQMTEPVERWIRRAAGRCATMGHAELAHALNGHAQAEAGHHLMMIADVRSLAARWNARRKPSVDACHTSTSASALLSARWSRPSRPSFRPRWAWTSAAE